jgi:hypothetical protein
MSIPQAQLQNSLGGVVTQSYLHNFNGYLFFTDISNKTFNRIHVSNPTSVDILFTSTDTMDDIADDGTYLYICNQTSGGISRYDISGNKDNSWTTTFTGKGWGLIIYQNYIYVSDKLNGTIAQISISSPNTYNTNWITGLTAPNGICIVGNYMYICSTTVPSYVYKTQINFSNNPPISVSTSIFLTITNNKYAWDIVSYNNTLFISNGNDNTIDNYDLNSNKLQTLTSPTTSTNSTGISIVATNSNISLFNINNSIYSYLLYTYVSNPPLPELIYTTDFSNNAQCFLTTYGDNMFISNDRTNNVYKISLSNPSSMNYLFNDGTNLHGLANDGTYLYTCNFSGGSKILKYDFNGNKDVTWSSNSATIVNANGLLVYGKYIYVARFGSSGGITQLRISDGSAVNLNWIPTGNYQFVGMCIVGNYMYVCNCFASNSGTIVQIPINFNNTPPTAGTVNANFITGLNLPWEVTSYDNTLFVSWEHLSSPNTQSQITIYDLSGTLLQTLTSPVNGSTECCGLAVAIVNRNTYLYNIKGNIYRYFLQGPPPTFSGNYLLQHVSYTH